MTIKVEIGFDLTDSPIGPFFALDSDVRGVLNNTEFTLAGTIFVDITEFVESISISRGKSRLLDKFQAGGANIVLNNTTRAFDPEFAGSQFAGNIVPRREVRISVDDEFQFFGVVDDWNLDYEPRGKQTATIIASDAFTRLANQSLEGGTQTAQLSGDRINSILSDAGVNFATDRRDVNAGTTILGADVIQPGRGALNYLQLVEQSELGRLFMGKDGTIVFKGSSVAPNSDTLVRLTDDGTGIPFQIVSVEYGSELLFNRVNVTSAITENISTANDEVSQGEYGIITLDQEGLLIQQDSDALRLATFLSNKFSEPEFRFRQIDVRLDELNTSDRAAILGLEMGDVVEVVFTPGTVGDPIDKFAEIIAIDNSIGVSQHILRFGFQTLDFTSLVLNDQVFGKLDSGNALGF